MLKFPLPRSTIRPAHFMTYEPEEKKYLNAIYFQLYLLIYISYN